MPFLNLAEGIGRVDDIDHLETVGFVPLVPFANQVSDFHGWSETFANDVCTR